MHPYACKNRWNEFLACVTLGYLDFIDQKLIVTANLTDTKSWRSHSEFSLDLWTINCFKTLKFDQLKHCLVIANRFDSRWCEFHTYILVSWSRWKYDYDFNLNLIMFFDHPEFLTSVVALLLLRAPDLNSLFTEMHYSPIRKRNRIISEQI